MPTHSEILYKYIEGLGYPNPMDFVKDRMETEVREDFNATYQWLLRLLKNEGSFKRNQIRRLKDELGIDDLFNSPTNTITGNHNNQAITNSTIGNQNELLKKIEELEKDRDKWKDKYISLLEKRNS